MRYSTISQIGAFTALNGATSDYLYLDPARCSGGADAGLRTTEEPAPGQDGALILPAFDDVWPIVLGGPFVIRSATTETGYIAALDTILASLKSALNALKAAPDDLVHSGGTLKVWKHNALETTFQNAQMTVTFGLVVDVFA